MTALSHHQHPLLRESHHDTARYDANRDRYERRGRVRHLTKIGMTNREIAGVVGITERTVERNRAKPAPPEPPRLYDSANVTDARAAELEARADLALRLAAVLHDEDPTVVWGALIRLDRRALQELAVIALAAIPVDATRTELLGWVADLPAARSGA